MSKELDAVQSHYKKIKSKLKPYTAKEAEKRLKAIRDGLKATWDKEDGLREAIKKAKEGGIEGDKPADFARDGGYGIGLAAWSKGRKSYRDQVDGLEKYSREAQKMLTPFRKLMEALDKAQKKAKPDAKAKKKLESEMKEVRVAFEDLQKAGEAYGTLKAHEAFYASNEKATTGKIVQEVTKKEKGGGSPKQLEEGALRKNLATAQKIAKTIEGICDGAGEKDARKKAQEFKKAKSHLVKLEKLKDDYQDLKKKEADRIKNSKQKKFIEDSIKKIETAFDDSEKAIKDAEKA